MSLQVLLCTTVCEEKIQLVPIQISFMRITFLLFFLQPGTGFHAVQGLAASRLLHPRFEPTGEVGACWMVAAAATSDSRVVIPWESRRQRRGLLVSRLPISTVGADLLEERVTHETPTNANLAFVWDCLTLMNNARVQPAPLFI